MQWSGDKHLHPFLYSLNVDSWKYISFIQKNEKKKRRKNKHMSFIINPKFQRSTHTY